MGKEGGIYIIELASALRRGGLATQMLREARKGWARGKGRVELQVHDSNVRARRYYERLGMHRYVGGGIGERDGGQRTAWKKWSVFCGTIATLLAKNADFNGVRLTRAELTTAESISAAVPPWDQRLQFSR